VNTKRTEYVVVSRHQNVGQNHDLLIANNSKMWLSSGTWEQQQQIKVAFMKKLRAD
jgi:hypothetical protein